MLPQNQNLISTRSGANLTINAAISDFRLSNCNDIFSFLARYGFFYRFHYYFLPIILPGDNAGAGISPGGAMSREHRGNSTRNTLFTRGTRRRHLLTICYARAMHASSRRDSARVTRASRCEILSTRSVGRTSRRSMMTNDFKGGGTDDFRSGDDESPRSPASRHSVTTLRDWESMCMGDPVGSGSLAVLTGNTMDPLFGKPRRLP